MSIRLLLDARKIFDGGIGVYTQNIIESLFDKKEIELSLLINPEQKPLILTKNFSWLSNVKFVEDRAKVLSLNEYFNLTKRVDFNNFDLYHTPFITLPFKISIPAVITIHDLIQVTHPEKFYYPTVAKLIIANSIKRARGILTVSKTSAHLIKKYFGHSQKVSVIPNVLSTSFLHSKITPSKFAQEKFLMAVYSNLKPHKGLRDLLITFSKLIKLQKISSETKLIIVGKGCSSLLESDLQNLIIACPQIINLGEVSEEELIALLAEAQALIVSSLVEGFSLPVLQAHSQGTPVIVRPVPAILELLGEGDFVAQDFSLEALADVIIKFDQNTKALQPKYDLSDYDLLALSDKLISYYKKILRLA